MCIVGKRIVTWQLIREKEREKGTPFNFAQPVFTQEKKCDSQNGFILDYRWESVTKPNIEFKFIRKFEPNVGFCSTFLTG